MQYISYGRSSIYETAGAEYIYLSQKARILILRSGLHLRKNSIMPND